MTSLSNPHHKYFVDMENGKQKRAHGQRPEDALDILRLRLSDEEMTQIRTDQFVKINQRKLQEHVHELG